MSSTVRREIDVEDTAKTNKRLKKDHSPKLDFEKGLFDDANVDRLHREYCESKPFFHAVVDKLFQNDLLTLVKDECLNELSFTEKHTDIYRVYQTGDLASLSYLDEEQIALLPNLLKLRNALYSPEFRAFVRQVTGCGPLSKQQDMSVNSYMQGCHLLNHDDVIGSRRVSYILYMPLPEKSDWRPEWGGSLELYPVKPNASGIDEPEPIPTKIIPPSWNQFVFFEVQPGHSFHSVEEVVVDENNYQRQRLSISGWFHKPQEGEEGFEEESTENQKSSLEQLTSTETTFTPYPLDIKTDDESTFVLSEDHLSFLSAFIDPLYLSPDNLGEICGVFVNDSEAILPSFLCEPLAIRLQEALRRRDSSDGLSGESRSGKIPAHNSGTEGESIWSIHGPPHKSRYCVLPKSSQKPKDLSEALDKLHSSESSAEDILAVLQNTLFPSPAFRSWLTLAAKVIPESYAVEARRFRPGLDYTLATSNDEQIILDVVLHLTPDVETTAKRDHKGKGKAKNTEDENEGNPNWTTEMWGGWDCYMAPHEGAEDPAVYHAGPRKREKSIENGERQESSHGPSNIHDDVDIEKNGDDSEDDEDVDGALLTVTTEFNQMCIVLREKTILHFVKYVSASAPGSRWDVSGEYTVSVIEDEEEEEETEDVEKME